MVSKLVNWLLGINEEDPIPYEVNHIYFYLEQNILGMGGTEQKSDFILDFEYYPIECHFFTEQKEYFNKNSLTRLKNLILDAYENEKLKSIYKNKTIHLGFLNQEILYSFTVN